MNTAKSQKIGDFFKDYRLRSSLQLQEICRALSVESENLIYQYENGNLRIPLPVIYAMANLYAIPTDQVLELFYKLSEHAEDVEYIPMGIPRIL